MRNYKQLEQIFDGIAQLNHLDAIVGWDEAVMMPTGGGNSRAKAMAYLHGLKHQQLTTPQVSDLLASCKEEQLEDDWQKANLRWMKKQHLLATAVPNELVKQFTQAKIECEQAWRVLREQNDWQTFKPMLEKVYELGFEASSHKASVLGLSVYDQCLDEFSPGFSQAVIDPIFNELKAFLPDVLTKIVDKQKSDDYTSLVGEYAVEAQRDLSKELMSLIGFDFNHGRFDVSHHPFCGGVADDVRITTRFDKQDFTSAVMGVCHETGHAMYELGLPREWLNQPVGMALGMALHESQSLLVEMQVCRSAEFMRVFSPKIKKYFGESELFSQENLELHYTRVQPGLIRVDADEVTYPLHIIMRYEIERGLFNREIRVDDLPEVWNQKMQQYLGLDTTGDFKNGVMQDVHWPCGLFGYFPAYTFGALIAAQLYQAALKHAPQIPTELTLGNFKPLMQWLRENIHNKASLHDFQTLLSDATGERLSPEFFIKHVKQRYLLES